MVATLRMYQDPTYSIPASSTAAMPVVVSRFYLEVSTKFTRNRITISDCTSAHVENSLNSSDALKPRRNYCDNSTFDTMTERSPNGVTHMDRLSMKKFKYQGTTDVFMQCKIRACAQQPCGVCTGNGDERRALSTDLNPAEGEMFAPPVSVRLSARDQNALVFGAPSGSAPRAQPATVSTTAQRQPASTLSATQKTSKPIEISSELTLGSISATWAVQNRASLIASLRSVLSLRADEDLVITAINAARRGRSLQAGGVRIEFVVGVSAADRANMSGSKLTQLSSGSAALVQQFSSQLDVELQSRGEAPIQLPASALAFNAPVTNTKPAATATASSGNPAAARVPATSSAVSSETAGSSGSTNSLLVVICVVLVLGIGAVLSQRRNGAAAHQQEAQPDQYASKVAGLDQIQQDFEMEAQ